MGPRFDYRRLEPETFNQALETVGISAREFAKITGANHRRVGEWLSGDNDIPPWVSPFMALMTLPGALDMARKVAAEIIVRDHENMHLGEYPFRQKQNADASDDAVQITLSKSDILLLMLTLKEGYRDLLMCGGTQDVERATAIFDRLRPLLPPDPPEHLLEPYP
jgi:hypothetical protein